jgi:hypothetical protein
LDAIYNAGTYNFHYAALCAGEPNVQPRRDSLNNHTVPTVYFDGGDTLLLGGWSDTALYTNLLDTAGIRDVPEIDLSVSLTYNADGTITVDVSATLETYINLAPEQPSVPDGVAMGHLLTDYTYTTSTTDVEGDQLWYNWDWGDGQTSGWLGPYLSGEQASAIHSWSLSDTYQIKVKARDELGEESEWSDVKWAFFEGLSGPCGDANDDDNVNISDAVYILNYVFVGGAPPLDSAESNCDGKVNVSDAQWIINYVFMGGNAPCICSGDDLDPGIADTVRVESVQVAIDPVNPVSFSVPVYLYNDESISGASLGLVYNSDNITIDSVTLTNGVASNAFSQSQAHPSGQMAIIGFWTTFSDDWVSSGQGTLANLWFTLDAGAPEHVINIDSLFFAPAGDFVLTKGDGNSLYPQFVAGTINVEQQVQSNFEWINVYCSYPTLNSAPLQTGDIIKSYDPDGILCGIDTVAADGSYGPMQVYRDDIFTTGDEGADPGDTIQFTINGSPVDSDLVLIWDANGSTHVICAFYDFICGDVNNDSTVNVMDMHYLADYIFQEGAPAPNPLISGEVNCDEKLNIGDALWMSNYLFNEGNEPCVCSGDTSDPGIPDTIKIGAVGVHGSPIYDVPFGIPITLVNDEEVGALSFGVTWIDSGFIHIDSISYSGSACEFMSFQYGRILPNMRSALFGFIKGDDSTGILPGENLIATIWCTVEPGVFDLIPWLLMEPIFIPPAGETMIAKVGGNSFKPKTRNGGVQVEETNLYIDPDSLIFNTNIGDTNPINQLFSLSGYGNLEWNATHISSWLSLSEYSGNTPSDINASIDITGLMPGQYIDTITISSAGAHNSPQYVQVTLIINEPQQQFIVSPSNFEFSTSEGVNPNSKDLNISSDGAALNWSASSTSSWLNLSLSNGSTPSIISVSVNVTGTLLPPGVYYDTISISEDRMNKDADPVAVPVTLTVQESIQPELMVYPLFLNFEATENGPNPVDNTVDITNVGDGTLDWTASFDAAWINMSSLSGTAPSTINVGVDIAGMAAGSYTDTVTIQSAGALNSPQYVEISLLLNPESPQGGDTVWISSDTTEIGQTAMVELTFSNDNLISSLQIPLYYDPAIATCDSVSFTGSRVEGAGTTIKSIDSANGTINIGFTADISSEIPFGSGLLARLYFTGLAEGFSLIDTGFISPASEYVFVDEFVMPFYPEFYAGGVQINQPEMNIQLHPGWNLVSWNLDTDDDDVANLVTGIISNLLLIMGFDDLPLIYDPALPGFSTLTSMDHLHGYWFSMANWDTLSITGQPVNPATPITLSEGWNLVSYLPDEADNIEDALGSIMGVVDEVLTTNWYGHWYNPDYADVANLLEMEPGGGYWIKVQTDTVLTYPAAVSGTSLTNNTQYLPKDTTLLKPTYEWINIFCLAPTLDGAPLDTGDVVQAFDPEGMLCGEVQMREDGAPLFLAVYRDDPYTTGTDEGASSGDAISIRINGVLVFTGSDIVWSNLGDEYEICSFNSSAPPVIGLSQASFNFESTLGANDTLYDTLEITNLGDQTLEWTIANTAEWISVDPFAGTAPSTVEIIVSTSGLSAGTHNTSLAVESPSATNSPQMVDFTLVINDPPPVIGLSQTSFYFEATAGSNAVLYDTLEITNDGGQTLEWNAFSNAPWIYLNPGSGTAPSTVQITIVTMNLGVGNLNGTIFVECPEAVNHPQGIDVTLVMNEPPPEISLSHSGFDIEVQQGGTDPANKLFTIGNSGYGTLNWTASNNGGWLSVSPSSGSLGFGSLDTVITSFDIAGLTTGIYHDTISISDPAASNSPQIVAITLSITSGLEFVTEFDLVDDIGGGCDDNGIINIGDSFRIYVWDTVGAFEIDYAWAWIDVFGGGTDSIEFDTIYSEALQDSAVFLDYSIPNYAFEGADDFPAATSYLKVGAIDIHGASSIDSILIPYAIDTEKPTFDGDSVWIDLLYDPFGDAVASIGDTISINAWMISNPIGEIDSVTVNMQNWGLPGSIPLIDMAGDRRYVVKIELPEGSLDYASGDPYLRFKVTAFDNACNFIIDSNECYFHVDNDPPTACITYPANEGGSYGFNYDIYFEAESPDNDIYGAIIFIRDSDTGGNPGAWHNFGAMSGTAPTFTVTIDSADMAANFVPCQSELYEAIIIATDLTGNYRQLADAVNDCPYETFEFNWTCDQLPGLVVDHGSFEFNSEYGTNPSSESLFISSEGDSILNWTLDFNSNWLEPSITAGQTPSTVNLLVNCSTMSVGIYYDTIILSSPEAGNSPVDIPVDLIIAPAAPEIELSDTVFYFYSYEGIPTTLYDTLLITDAGGGSFLWGADNDSVWLTLNPDTGNTPAEVTLTVDNTGMIEGIYIDTIMISSVDAINSPRYVSVVMTVFPPLPMPDYDVNYGDSADFYFLSSADIDRDNYTDIIYTGSLDEGLYVAYGDPIDTLSEPYKYLDINQAAIVIDYLDSTTFLDFAAVTSNNLYIFLNQGDRTFEIDSVPITNSGLPSLASGRIDNDVYRDLVVAPDLIYFGDIAGGYSSSITTPFTFEFVTTCDFNRDGLTDLLTTNVDSIIIYLNQGEGNFIQSDYHVMSPPSLNVPPAAALSDFNRDRNCDFALVQPLDSSEEISTLSIGLSDSQGTLLLSYNISITGLATNVVSSDVDRDNRIDLIVANGSMKRLEIFYGQGNGYFSPPVYIPLQVSEALTFALATLDLNRDGNPDFVSGGLAGDSLVLAIDQNDSTTDLPDEMVVSAYKGVNLEVINPDSYVISENFQTVAGADYWVYDINEDGYLDEESYDYNLQYGDYTIILYPGINDSVGLFDAGVKIDGSVKAVIFDDYEVFHTGRKNGNRVDDSVVFYYTVEDSPYSIEPFNGEIYLGTRPSFNWTPLYIDSNKASAFQFQLDTFHDFRSNMLIYDSIIDTTFFQPASAIGQGTVFYWHVRPIYSGNPGEYSHTFAVFVTGLCGDCNSDGYVNVSDAMWLVLYIFDDGKPPPTPEVGDVNCDGMVNVSDVVYLVNYIFNKGPCPCHDCPFNVKWEF